MEKKKKPNGYWNNYENCFNAAKECGSKSEFVENYGSAYNSASKHGWLDDYTWFVTNSKPRGYWLNYDNCYNEAKMFDNRTDFANKCYGAYRSSLKNGWIDDYVWFKRPINIFKDKVDTVYAYLFEKTKTVYVGRTVELNKRDRVHRGLAHLEKKDPVFEYSSKSGIEIPHVIVLKNELTLEEGLFWEDWYRTYYENLGYTMLNIAKTGVGSGSIGNIGGYTKKQCYEAAMQCKTKKEFMDRFICIYQKARKKKWLQDYTWLVGKNPDGYWLNYDNCYNEAKKYNSREEFHKKNGTAYNRALKFGWLDDYTWFESRYYPRGYWNNYDRCYEAAKGFKLVKEFAKQYGTAYHYSLKNGWIKDFVWFA